MNRIVNIAYQGGTHGNFLRYCVDKFSALTPPLHGEPFGGYQSKLPNNTSHMDLDYSDAVHRYHPYDGFQNINEPHILITVDVNDLVFLERWITMRAGNYGIDTNKDKIILTSEFLDAFDWRDRFRKYYKIDVTNTAVPRFLLRDFYKMSFLDTAKNGFIANDSNLKNSAPSNTFYFPVSCFWDKDQFKTKLHELDEELHLEMDLSDVSIHEKFISKLDCFDTKDRAKEVVGAIKTKKQMDIRSLDTVEQAYVSAWIENNYEFVTVPLTNSFFNDTLDILSWLEAYPEHYKAMNPNLPMFNGIPNPFHLWNKNK